MPFFLHKPIQKEMVFVAGDSLLILTLTVFFLREIESAAQIGVGVAAVFATHAAHDNGRTNAVSIVGRFSSSERLPISERGLPRLLAAATRLANLLAKSRTANQEINGVCR